MTLVEFAIRVLDAADSAGVNFMVVGAIAAGAHGIPRATRDLDLLVEVVSGKDLDRLIGRMDDFAGFGEQTVFDTMTWGRRHVGQSRSKPPFKVELFELFDDPFVQSEFGRREKVHVPLLNRTTWLPTAEDVIVQKLRWGRSKDLDDARDVLAVQGS